MGGKNRGGVGVYIVPNSRENREGNRKKSGWIWLGFRCSFLAREVEGDDVIAGVIGGTHLAVREKGGGLLSSARAVEKRYRSWASAQLARVSFFFVQKLFFSFPKNFNNFLNTKPN